MSMFEAVHPVLMVRNVSASVDFYLRLGFILTFQDRPVNPRYAVIHRDAVELHLQWQDESQWAFPIDRPCYRFLVKDVDELHWEIQSSGSLSDQAESNSTWRTPGDTPWGTREFHIGDPDGNVLQFYRPA